MKSLDYASEVTFRCMEVYQETRKVFRRVYDE